MNKLAFAAAAMLAATVALPAAAATVIDFDNLPDGTVLPVNSYTAMTTQYASLGVTFEGYNGTTPGAPNATNYSGGPSNAAYSGNYLGNFGIPVNYGSTLLATRYDRLSIVFSAPVNNVSFGLNTFYTQGFAIFKAYDSAGALLQNITFTANDGWAIKTLSAGAIARIDITPAMINPSTIAMFGIDKLTYTPIAVAAVPEPTSWVLMIAGFGLVGAGLRRRRTPRTIVSFA